MQCHSCACVYAPCRLDGADGCPRRGRERARRRYVYQEWLGPRDAGLRWLVAGANYGPETCPRHATLAPPYSVSLFVVVLAIRRCCAAVATYALSWRAAVNGHRHRVATLLRDGWPESRECKCLASVAGPGSWPAHSVSSKCYGFGARLLSRKNCW